MTMQSESINELAAALAKAQGAMRNAAYNRTNPHFKNKYADLASVLDAAREPLSANGLALVQQTLGNDGRLWLRSTLLHSSGQWMAAEYPLPGGGKPQEIGAALTYARRYSLSALVGIAADDDDDAEGATARAPKTLNGGTKTAPDATKAAPNGGHITPEQVKVLLDLCAAKGRTVEDFCTWREIDKPEHLPAHRYDGTLRYLQNMEARK
jgi:hypothetical protein